MIVEALLTRPVAAFTAAALIGAAVALTLTLTRRGAA